MSFVIGHLSLVIGQWSMVIGVVKYLKLMVKLVNCYGKRYERF